MRYAPTYNATDRYLAKDSVKPLQRDLQRADLQRADVQRDRPVC